MIVEHISSCFTGYTKGFDVCRNLLSFYMPFFFFRSGLFASNTGWMDVLKKNAKRYLIPYVVWGIITFIAVIICQIYEGSISVQSLIIRPIKDTYILGSFLTEGPTWFLLTLLSVKTIGARLVSVEGANAYNGGGVNVFARITAICCILVAYAIYKFKNPYVPQIIANTCTGLFFYLSGVMMKNNNNNNGVAVIAIMAYVVSYFLPCPDVAMHWNMLLRGKYLLWFPTCIFGILTFMYIFKLMSKYYSFPILNWAGVNSLYLMVAHWPLLILLHKLVLKDVFGLSNPMVEFWICVVSCGVLLYAFSPIYQKFRYKAE